MRAGMVEQSVQLCMFTSVLEVSNEARIESYTLKSHKTRILLFKNP